MYNDVLDLFPLFDEFHAVVILQNLVQRSKS